MAARIDVSAAEGGAAAAAAPVRGMDRDKYGSWTTAVVKGRMQKLGQMASAATFEIGGASPSVREQRAQKRWTHIKGGLRLRRPGDLHLDSVAEKYASKYRNASRLRRAFRGSGAMYRAAATLGGANAVIALLCYSTPATFASFTTEPHKLMGTLLAFLVVFRAQMCFNRWWEGRGHIGDLSASLKTLLLVMRARHRDKLGVHAPRLSLICFATTLLQVWSEPSSSAVESLTEGVEADALALHPKQRPLLVLTWLSDRAAKASYVSKPGGGDDEAAYGNTRQREGGADVAADTALWSSMDKAVAALNGCAKITSTPIPYPYHSGARLCLYVWTFTLPMALTGDKPEALLMNVFTSFTITYLYFLVSFISEDMENPFSGALAIPLYKVFIGYVGEVKALFPEFCRAYDPDDGAERPGAAVAVSDGHDDSPLEVCLKELEVIQHDMMELM